MSDYGHRIHENPEALIDFARYIEGAAEELVAAGEKAEEQAEQLEEHWQDEHYREFHARLEQELPAIKHFAERAEAFAAFLKRRVGAIEAYNEV